jgi:hypothetical protein
MRVRCRRDAVLRRIELLAALGTGIVTLSGGEPLLHPDLDQIVRHVLAQENGICYECLGSHTLVCGGEGGIRPPSRYALRRDCIVSAEPSRRSSPAIDRERRSLAERVGFVPSHDARSASCDA